MSLPYFIKELIITDKGDLVTFGSILILTLLFYLLQVLLPVFVVLIYNNQRHMQRTMLDTIKKQNEIIQEQNESILELNKLILQEKSNKDSAAYNKDSTT